MENKRIKFQYSTVFITLVSILLGITLGDLITIFRSIDSPSLFAWLSMIYTILVIMNAWVSYSLHAISVELLPKPADAVNVFALSAAHFALNSFIGKPHYQFFYAVAAYCIISYATVYYTVWRGTQDDTRNYSVKPYNKVLSLNIIGVPISLCLGYLSMKGLISTTIENLSFIIGLLFVVTWLVWFWKAWKRQLINN